MRVRKLHIASLVVMGLLLPILMFVNIFVGNTLSSFGFLVFIVGLLLVIVGIFVWVFSGLVERYKHLSSVGLYLIYGGLAFVLLGVICIVLAPVIHSFGPQWVFPD
ncbi:MAG: hypothetical protein Q6361_03980 [Candidatus Hermodarchaeota archaeon]|jgi:hypothetical protein|nr:hypothetical protein [Candidatus Hermodarchaeota archaeon]